MILREFLRGASTVLPLAAFVGFFAAFVILLGVLARRSPDRYREVSALPLNDEGEKR